MLFNSFSFLIFFPLVTIIYFLLPHKYRWFHLLVASCVFYMFFIPIYILILFITILIDYFAGIYIENTTGVKKKMYLIFSIISTCLVLFVFKYFNFFNTNFKELATVLHLHYPIPLLNIILPIGLSFHTFQSLSYVIEVYRGNQKTEKNFGIYALYVMFYPQLVAGPIERPQNLLHQFYEKHSFDIKRIIDGLKLMLWGLFKKVVIADRLSVVVNQIYNDPHQYNGIHFIVATIFFAFQIYCDFSGYSDIAIGSAKVMGFKLMTNFRKPYFSKSISEFWKRWHISLSTWFRDYLYISLGGNRVVKWRLYFNLVVTFLVSGLWHGANWTYVIWGGLNGMFIVFETYANTVNVRIPNIFRRKVFFNLSKFGRMLFTFSLISIAWIFFRANNLKDSMYILTHLFSGIKYFMSNLNDEGYISGVLNSFGVIRFEFFLSFGLIVLLLIIESFDFELSFFEKINDFPIYIRWMVYYLIIGGLLFFGTFNTPQQFIYFQF